MQAEERLSLPLRCGAVPWAMVWPMGNAGNFAARLFAAGAAPIYGALLRRMCRACRFMQKQGYNPLKPEPDENGLLWFGVERIRSLSCSSPRSVC